MTSDYGRIRRLNGKIKTAGNDFRCASHLARWLHLRRWGDRSNAVSQDVTERNDQTTNG